MEKNAKLKGDGGNNSTPMKDGVNENGNDDNCNDGDRCRVCNRGGNLIHCSQSVCSNSFHFDCILPVPEEEITKDWNCAFCDAAYITGMKPQTKKRRLAVIAVKEMEQIRADLDSGKVSPSKRKVDDLDDETSPSRSKRQRRARKHRIDDDDDEDEPNKKSQQRQQQELPILNKDEIPVEILRRLAPKSINSNSKHGQFHCKFCMDDDNTATCCFCACRVCFSKHDRSSTMLCDICDAEYHMNCLSPPLSSLPSTDWFCPTCVKVITDSDNLVKKIPTATTKGKSPNKVGRPPKAKSAKTNNNQSLLKANFASKQPRDNSGRFASKTSSPQPDQPVKRGPGRPPKNLSKVKVLTPMPVPSIKTGTGRPRGRPPKNKKAIVVTANGGQGSALKSLRSSSKVNPPKKTGTGRPRGRPPKNLKLNNVGKNHKSSLQVKTSPHEEAYSDLESQSTSQNANYDKFDDESDVHMFAEAHNNANIRSNTLNPAPSFIPEITMKTNEETSVSIDEFERAKAAAMGVFTGNTKSMIESSKRSKSSNGDIKQVQKVPRRKPGARECLQISRRFGANIIPQQYMETLLVSLNLLALLLLSDINNNYYLHFICNFAINDIRTTAQEERLNI